MHRQDPVWLEVALNGAAGRQYQPGIPITPDEIIADGVACAKAGAAIVHFHAYDVDAGTQVEDAEIYTEVIEGIRAQCDVIVYPTLALQGTMDERYEPIKVLMDRGLLEWGVVDPGSVNLTHKLHVAFGGGDIVYPNPTDHIREGLRLAVEGGWRPAYAIYEPGFARLGAAVAERFPELMTPIYRIMFSDNMLFGTPPTRTALEFYSSHLHATAPGAPWMVSGIDANIDALIEPALEMGAHLRVGLEDAPLGTERTNVDYVETTLKKIVASGGRPATPHEIRNC